MWSAIWMFLHWHDIPVTNTEKNTFTISSQEKLVWGKVITYMYNWYTRPLTLSQNQFWLNSNSVIPPGRVHALLGSQLIICHSKVDLPTPVGPYTYGCCFLSAATQSGVPSSKGDLNAFSSKFPSLRNELKGFIGSLCQIFIHPYKYWTPILAWVET